MNRLNKSKLIKSKRRGQVALEFIMTYGWALLLVTTLVAGLAYIMPHPKSLAANTCVFGSAIPCLGAQLNSSELTIVLRNGLGQSIYEIRANETMPSIIPKSCDVSNVTARAEERIVIICNNSGDNGMNLTDDTRIRVELTYKKVKDGYDQSIIGEIYAKYTE
jgi:hypothetical protein